MTSVAVVAHSAKRLGGGLGELRDVLSAEGVTDPLWAEVPKSKFAPGRVREALDHGADLVFVWGGDGTVQRSLGELAGSPASLAILPAGTANLLATNLGIPRDLEAAVRIGLHGRRRTIDVGNLNGERFAVMAGTGLDALMIEEADGGMKDAFGRVAYLWTGAKNVRRQPVRTKIRVDGHRWFKGDASCVLVGNVGIGRRRHRRVPRRAPRRRPARRGRGHRRRRVAVGAHVGHGPRSATRRPRRSSRRRRHGRSRSGSTGRCRTRWTAANVRRRSASTSRWNLPRSRSAFPRRSQHEHGEHDPGDLGPRRGRCPSDDRADGATAAAARCVRTLALVGRVQSRTIDRVPPRPGLHRGRDRPRGLGERPRVRRVERGDRPWSPDCGAGACGSGPDGGRVAGTPGWHRLPIRRVGGGLDRPRSSREPRSSVSSSARSTGSTASSRTGRRCGSTGTRSCCCARPVCWRCSVSPASRSATSSAPRSTTMLWTTVWNVARWPVGLLFITGADRADPSARPAPAPARLVVARRSGALLAVALWVAVTAALRCLLPRQLDVRPDVRSAGRHRGAAALVVADRRSRCSTACPWPRSSKPCARACRHRSDAEGRRDGAAPRSADGRRLPIDDAGA